ncbi:MAG TPA: glutaminyl-peptide cyclotransferase [Allosphingosinicella sp.]|jgi:glutaminyl-peptide cyclotransferase|nr:glutaminyl-peptide cyclotransferase [Allosphingosinicella sp.]
MMKPTLFLLPLALLFGCSASPPAKAPVYGVRIVHSYPHDIGAFTEGLFYKDGHLFESTGLNGRSEIREERLEDGHVLRSTKVDARYFGEGIVDWGPEIRSLTWQGGVGFRWSRADFAKLGEFHYPGEGWALTRNATEIVMSDGTPQLRFLDPATMAERRRITVTDEGRPVERLNELEWVKGEIYANVWMTPRIARIDPKTGHVTGWIDLTQLVAEQAPPDEDSVLNGIAYDSAHDRLFVTGKNWPKLFEIRLVAPGRK